MTDNASFFIGRQSILDRKGELAGFELLFRSGQKNAANFRDHVVATSSVVSHAINEVGFKTVLGKHRGYINVDAKMLLDDTLELLPSDSVVIELLESIDITPEVVARCKYLKSRGYLLALDDFNSYSHKIEPLRNCIDIVKIDLKLCPQGKLADTIHSIRDWPIQLLAEKVDNLEEARMCMELGFHLFQGYYFSKPIIITGKRLSHSELALMRLFNLVVSDVDTAQIEQVFKQNPGLSFYLLRLTNSAAAGAQIKVTSIANAITTLGRRPLQRWLQLLLYAKESHGSASSPLMQLAATRGRCMELLAQRMDGHTSAQEDYAFMVGIMSLMDALLGMPLAEVIAPLDLPQDVREALLERTGGLGELLSLMECQERCDMEVATALLERLAPLTIEQVNQAQLEALAWSNSFQQVS
jgi:c-di-GMP-related signal transduction protein